MKRQRVLRITSLCAAVLLLASISAPLAPTNGWATAWTGLYPSSPSLNHVVIGTGTNCQLCHVSSFGGGDNYNAYGYALKLLDDAGHSRNQSLAMAEGMESDGDPGGFTNLAEIMSGAQPGWTAGPNNTIYDENGNATPGQMPPAGILAPLDSLSYPTLVHNGTGVNPLVLSDTGGDPNVSPRLNMPSEPFAVTIDCSSAPASGVYAVQIRPILASTPISTQFGELLFLGPVLFKSSGFHNQSAVGIGPIVLPYDLTLLDRTYFVQGFCGSSTGGAFLSNALEQRVGV